MVRRRIGQERGLLGSYMYDVNAYDENGMTPLHCAAAEGHVECCEHLLELSAQVAAHSALHRPSVLEGVPSSRQ